MIKLEVLNTAFKGRRFKFRDGMTVGSGPEATIRAQHPELQAVHARFYAGEQGRPTIETAAPEAHLFINGKDVIRGELKHNDEVVVGPLRFKVLNVAMMSSASLRLDQLMDEMEKHQDDNVYDFAREDLFYLTNRDPTLRERVSFSIPSKDRFIEQAQAFLSRLVKQSSMEEAMVEAFMTCAKELILNAHRHGHKFDESKKIVLRYRDLGKRIQLAIEDEGEGFDHKSVIGEVQAKSAAQAARERYQAGGQGGLGFKLVCRLAKDLSYNGKGNVATYSIAKEMGG